MDVLCLCSTRDLHSSFDIQFSLGKQTVELSYNIGVYLDVFDGCVPYNTAGKSVYVSSLDRIYFGYSDTSVDYSLVTAQASRERSPSPKKRARYR